MVRWFLLAALVFGAVWADEATPMAKRQASTATGVFSIGSLDPSLSSALQSALQSASSYAQDHSTVAFTSYSYASQCPEGGQMANGVCCTSGIVISGKCYEGTTSVQSTSAAPTSTLHASSNGGTVISKPLTLAACMTLFSLYLSQF
jgi:hypothetical protein